jgi:hypothetical protein
LLFSFREPATFVPTPKGELGPASRLGSLLRSEESHFFEGALRSEVSNLDVRVLSIDPISIPAGDFAFAFIAAIGGEPIFPTGFWLLVIAAADVVLIIGQFGDAGVLRIVRTGCLVTGPKEGEEFEALVWLGSVFRSDDNHFFLAGAFTVEATFSGFVA